MRMHGIFGHNAYELAVALHLIFKMYEDISELNITITSQMGDYEVLYTEKVMFNKVHGVIIISKKWL